MMTPAKLAGTIVATCLAMPLAAQPIIVAEANGPVPDRPGEFFSRFAGLGTPRIDDTGRVWFTGSWGASIGDEGLFEGTPSAPRLVIQEADPIPGLSGQSYFGFQQLAVSRTGIDDGCAGVD
ncbi:MAG: hypothetical protein AAFO89_11210, partial [Planctomycetota bacterium]